MNVLGDVLEAIIRSMEVAANSKRANDEEPLLKRPWTDLLASNKAKWADKHESGN